MTITDRPPTETTTTAGPPTRRRPPLPQIVGGGVLVFIGLLWLLERIGTIDISVTAVLALGTIVTGIALMILASDGAHGGLIVFGTVLALITLVTAAAPFEGFQGGVGDRTVDVVSIQDIQSDYNLAIGKLTVDLSEVDDFRAGTPVTASVGMGELVVLVPEDTEVEVEARIGAGQLEIFGRTFDGVGIDESYQSDGFAQSSRSVSLELQAFTGRVEVTSE